jgi:hypothetical protein
MTWKLIKSRTFDSSGHQVPSALGREPMGVMLFENARLMIMIGDGRSRVAPLGVTACCGSYSFDGHTLVASIDAASGPDLLGEFIRWVRSMAPADGVKADRWGPECRY